MKVLLVDDDISLCRELAALLKDSGYKVEVANNGEDALMLATEFGFDLLLLDISMPGMTGFQVCEAMRKAQSKVPIIFLTGKNQSMEKEKGLDLGADDYVTKPFDTRELLARIRAVLRRAAGVVTNDISARGGTLIAEGRILVFGDSRISLTATEFGIVELMMRRAPQPLSSKEIFRSVWPSDSDSYSDTVRVHIRILRKKLELIAVTDFIQRNSEGYFIGSE